MNATKPEKQSGYGGKREGAGRKRGVPNKVTAELGEAARAYTPLALRTLADICENGSSESARVAAATAILDRGHGKPKQVVEPAAFNVNVGPGAAVTAVEPVSATLRWLQEVVAESKPPLLERGA